MFYLKYRPQRVKDLDLEAVRLRLEEALQAKALPHAFLFAGPKGTGKTSAARILAKAINCEKRVAERKNLRTEELTNGRKKKKKSSLVSRLLGAAEGGYEPCNQCSICKSITKGTSLDLIEIDAASNRGIDDIRNLRERVRLSPTEARYKVYVIDEAHMLTREAFNALLKTLEEPPAHVVFVLATTEPEKLPETIISRCLYLQFQKGKPEEIKRSLARVIKGEKIKVDKEALAAIGKTADGSFRDAQKILEQLAMKKRKITLKMVEEEVAGGRQAGVSDFLKLLAGHEAQKAVERVNQKVEEGLNLESLVVAVLETLRQLLLASVGVDSVSEGLGDLSQSLSKKEILDLITLFEQAHANLKGTVIPQLPLEMAVVSWCLAEQNLPVGEVSVVKQNQSVKKDVSFKEEVEEESLVGNQANGDNPVGLGEIKEKWDLILRTLRPQNHSVEALLKAARPLKMSGRILTVEVFYPFHQERLNTEKNRQLIEGAVERVMKRPLVIKCVLGGKRPNRGS